MTNIPFFYMVPGTFETTTCCLLRRWASRSARPGRWNEPAYTAIWSPSLRRKAELRVILRSASRCRACSFGYTPSSRRINETGPLPWVWLDGMPFRVNTSVAWVISASVRRGPILSQYRIGSDGDGMDADAIDGSGGAGSIARCPTVEGGGSVAKISLFPRISGNSIASAKNSRRAEVGAPTDISVTFSAPPSFNIR